MVAPSVRLYLDASAVVKAVITEPESQALVAYLARASSLVSSRLVVVEVARAVARLETETGGQAEEVLAAIDLLEMDEAACALAARIPPTTLRTLDAIHLASAYSIRAEIDALVTYDVRLADAARASGMRVVAPA